MAASGEGSAAAVPASAAAAAAHSPPPLPTAIDIDKLNKSSSVITTPHTDPLSFSSTGWPAFAQGYRKIGCIGEVQLYLTKPRS